MEADGLDEVVVADDVSQTNGTRTSGHVALGQKLLGQEKGTKLLDNYGKIGFLPNGLWHIGIKICGTNLCADINH